MSVGRGRDSLTSVEIKSNSSIETHPLISGILHKSSDCKAAGGLSTAIGVIKSQSDAH